MSGKADFTEDEWTTLHRGATGAGMLVAMSERGFTSTFKESGALAKYMAEARSGGTSQLVRELAAEKGTGWKVSSSPEEVHNGTVEALKASVVTLEAKDPTELESYRAFVLALSQAVSDAAKGGEDVEAQAIVAIRDALGS